VPPVDRYSDLASQQHNLTLGYLPATPQQMVSKIFTEPVSVLILTEKIQYLQPRIRKSPLDGTRHKPSCVRIYLAFTFSLADVLV
jgi:hypothetical protein